MSAENNPPSDVNEYKEEKTVKVKRKKEREVKIPPCLIKELEGFLAYFHPESEETAKKSSKVEIRGLSSEEIAKNFNQFPVFPLHLKDMEIILLGEELTSPEDVNIVLKNIVTKKPELESLKLTIYDVNRSLKTVDFRVLRELKSLKVLKINVGMNNLEPETQENLLLAYQGHPDLLSLCLIANNCDLQDDFLLKIYEKIFLETLISKTLRKLWLNLAQNPFKFSLNFDSHLLRKFFFSFESIEKIKLNFAHIETLDLAFAGMERILEEVITKILTLRVLKLNFFSCHLQRKSIEIFSDALGKMNEKLEIHVDLREPVESMPGIGTIRVIEGLVSLFRAVTNHRKYNIFY